MLYFFLFCGVVVLGCGGDWDKGKWLIMVKIVVDKSDVCIIIFDNLRIEKLCKYLFIISYCYYYGFIKFVWRKGFMFFVL